MLEMTIEGRKMIIGRSYCFSWMICSDSDLVNVYVLGWNSEKLKWRRGQLMYCGSSFYVTLTHCAVSVSIVSRSMTSAILIACFQSASGG